MGTVLGGSVIFCDDIPDSILTIGHALNIIVQTNRSFGVVVMGGRKAQQLGNFFAIRIVFSGTFFKNFTKGVPKLLILF